MTEKEPLGMLGGSLGSLSKILPSLPECLSPKV